MWKWKWINALLGWHYIIVQCYYGRKVKRVVEGAHGTYVSHKDREPFILGSNTDVVWRPLTFTMEEFANRTVFDEPVKDDPEAEEHH